MSVLFFKAPLCLYSHWTRHEWAEGLPNGNHDSWYNPWKTILIGYTKPKPLKSFAHLHGTTSHLHCFSMVPGPPLRRSKATGVPLGTGQPARGPSPGSATAVHSATTYRDASEPGALAGRPVLRQSGLRKFQRWIIGLVYLGFPCSIPSSQKCWDFSGWITKYDWLDVKSSTRIILVDFAAG